MSSIKQAIPRLAVAASLCLSVSAQAQFSPDLVQDPYVREWYARDRPEAVERKLQECIEREGKRHQARNQRAMEITGRACLCMAYFQLPVAERPDFCGGTVHRK